MPVITKTLRSITITREGGIIRVRADYVKQVVEEGVEDGFMLDVTGLVPDWGLTPKWQTVQGIIEQH